MPNIARAAAGRWSSALAVAAVTWASPSFATQANDTGEDSSGAVEAETADPSGSCQNDPCVISYPPDFFTRYLPITALDMVRQVPGFQIDNGDNSRGFGGAAGNVLINGERPSTKSDSASGILSRIPAGNVERIDLIRGQAGGLDLRGQSVAVNVILSQSGGPAVRWSAGGDYRFLPRTFQPDADISLTHSIGSTNYTVGFEAVRFGGASAGPELVSDGDGALIEVRDEFGEDEGGFINLNLNTESRFGDLAARFNGEAQLESFDFQEESLRTAVDTGILRPVIQGGGSDELSYEVGADIEYPWTDSFSTKLIALYRRENDDGGNFLRTPNEDNTEVTISRFQSQSIETETIARGEADFTGFKNHVIEFAAEGALNVLDNTFALTVEDASGAVDVAVPGANTRVEERRGDFSISDSWSLGKVVLDTEIAAEVSTIEQSGETGAERSFFFPKPSFSATFAPTQKRQYRARVRRAVAQLNFFQFVSSTDFDDEELALGNPELKPERTWIFDATVEQRFGAVGAVEITGFYNRITDVQDVLPLGGILEIPGNIGSGQRWGVNVEGTLPLGWTGLNGARLDFEAEWQDSSVTDPVTGLDRQLSDERPWEVEIEFRQDLLAEQIAYGWDIDFRSESPSFGLDEFDEFHRTPRLNAFIETTRLGWMKVTLATRNLLNEGNDRRRTVFTGQRDLSPVLFREDRERNNGRQIRIGFSGTF